MPGACQELDEGSNSGWVTYDDARAKEKCIRVERDAAGRGVVGAEVADEAQERDRLVGDRAADAVLVDAVGVAKAEVGVSDGGVERGLGPRRNGEHEESQAEKEQAFHR